MRKLFTALKGIAVMLMVLSVITGCSTGGLSDKTSSPSPTPTPTTGNGAITFAVVKSSDPNAPTTSISPDSPAIVKATAIDSTGAAIAGRVMTFASTFDILFSPASRTALTDANGTAAITVMVGATAGAATIAASVSDSAGTVITNDIGLTVNLQPPPAVPAGMTATAISSSQINLSWTASAGAAGYKIFKGGALFTAVTPAAATDTGLLASTQYCYAVSAFDGSGNESTKSSQVCATTYGPAPPPPITLTARATSPTQVDLSWTASAGAAQYKVYRNGALLAGAVVTAPATTYADKTVVANTQYAYTVTAVDSTGSESGPTGQSPVNTGLTVPSGVTATVNSSTQITLSWTNSGGVLVKGYNVYKNGTLSGATTTTSIVDGGLTASTQYCYSTAATDVSGNESAKSSQVCATTYGPPPAVPAGLTVRATLPTQVDLSWTASAGASQYKIYRNGTLLTATNTTSYADTTVAANTPYTYTVTAIDATGSESGPTGQALANTGLTVPSNVTATVNSATQITISWANSGGALVSGYRIYKNGTLLGAVTGLSLVDGGLAANTQSCYSVSATSAVGGESAPSVTVCGTTQPPPVPASVDLLVSSPQLNSDGASTVTLTAVVKDTGNRALAGQAVSFTADSGLLTVTNGTTGATGTATATLGTGGDPSFRPINLTASTAGINAVNTVTVTGTTLSISGSSSLSFGDSAPLTIFLKDSFGTGVAGKTVTVTSDNGNTLSAVDPYVTKDANGNVVSGSYKTDANGQVIVTVMATVGGPDKIRAAAIGVKKDFDLTVNANILKFTSPSPPPAAATEIAIGALQPVAVQYTIGVSPAVGVTVNFVTTRGTLSAASAVTDASGIATVNVSANNSGPVLFLASIANGPSAQVAAEFVATTVNSVTLQAAPNTIGTNSGGLTTEKSLITAVVRDANNNLVKNKTVDFNIEDPSGGSLSPPSSITDGSGTASTYFIAGGAPSPLNGVKVHGTVTGTLVTGTTTLTVAKKSLFITLATGPAIQGLADGIRYQKDYVALVTDAAGDPVAGATVVATVTPVYYRKGYWIWSVGASAWRQVPTLLAASSTLPNVPACANEDGITHNSLYDFNGVLDPGEDQNGNRQLDPGNVASVTATTTDATGHSTVSIVYAKDYAYWVNVKLEAFTSTTGSNASAFVTFDLPGVAGDYTQQNVSPPGNPSPFGTSANCFVDLTVTPISTTDMAIIWQKSTNAASYNVYRGGAKVGNITTNSFTDTGLTGGTQYCYEIKTVSALGVETVFTGPGLVCGTTNSVSPPTPSFTVTGQTDITISLSLTNSVGAVMCNVYRNGVLVATVPVAGGVTKAWTDGTILPLTPNTQYCYAIRAVSAAGAQSALTDQQCTATTP